MLKKLYLSDAALFLYSNTGSGCRYKLMFTEEQNDMKKRVAVISIIVEDVSNIETLNTILSQYREYIIGRMGLPYREKKVSIICVAMECCDNKHENEINAMTGKIGRLSGISAKINYSNIITEEQ